MLECFGSIGHYFAAHPVFPVPDCLTYSDVPAPPSVRMYSGPIASKAINREVHGQNPVESITNHDTARVPELLAKLMVNPLEVVADAHDAKFWATTRM